MPERIAELVTQIKKQLPCELGIHCHNDCDLAVANTLSAVRAGVTQVQGTMNGIGERCGNVDLVSVIANLALKYEYQVLQPESLIKLTEASRYVYELANMNFRPGQPFVGQSAFAHKGGMHTHAVAKDPSTYEHITPELVGNERRILVSELSGQSTIVTKTAKYALATDKTVMAKILQQVQDLEFAGYEFEAAEASFDLLVRKATDQYRPWFERLSYRVETEHLSGQLLTEATVKVKIGEAIEHTVSEGDGPVNALDGALRKALRVHYPQLDEMHLVDYKVRVVNARAGTAARVRVVIESRDSKDVWGTVGVSENIIEASWLALMESFEYKLFKDQDSR
jgi:2-isopropylmalate synthase